LAPGRIATGRQASSSSCKPAPARPPAPPPPTATTTATATAAVTAVHYSLSFVFPLELSCFVSSVVPCRAHIRTCYCDFLDRPHRAFWTSLPGLIKTGFRFSIGRFCVTAQSVTGLGGTKGFSAYDDI